MTASHLTPSLSRSAALLSIFYLLRPSSSSSKSGAAGGRVALYIRRTRLIDSIHLRLRCHDPSSPSHFPLRLSPDLRLLRRRPDTPRRPLARHHPSLLRSLPADLHDHPALLRHLAKRLAIASRSDDLRALLRSLHSSPMDLLRLSSATGDLPSALRAFSSFRNSARRGHPPTESYRLKPLHGPPCRLRLLLQHSGDLFYDDL